MCICIFVRTSICNIPHEWNKEPPNPKTAPASLQVAATWHHWWLFGRTVGRYLWKEPTVPEKKKHRKTMGNFHGAMEPLMGMIYQRKNIWTKPSWRTRFELWFSSFCVFEMVVFPSPNCIKLPQKQRIAFLCHHFSEAFAGSFRQSVDTGGTLFNWCHFNCISVVMWETSK